MSRRAVNIFDTDERLRREAEERAAGDGVARNQTVMVRRRQFVSEVMLVAAGMAIVTPDYFDIPLGAVLDIEADGLLAIERGEPLGEAAAMGELACYDNATATVITTASTYTLVSVPAMRLFTGMEFDSPADGRLRYTGDVERHFHCGVTISVKGAGANDVVAAVLYKNGGVNGSNEFTSGWPLYHGQTVQKLSAAGDIASTAIHAMVRLAPQDYLELGIANRSDTDDLTVTDMNLFAVGMPT